MAADVGVAVTLSHIVGPLSGPHQAGLLDLARDVEAAGVDLIVLSEHVALTRVVEGHPGGASGAFGFPYDEEYPEPLVALAAIAAVTSRVRLGTNVLIAPLRPAVLLAKMAATVDVLSGGRLELGVGIGWLRAEFSALGVPWEGVGGRIEDTVAACRLLWRGEPVSFSSATVRFEELCCSPAPVQRTRLPVWFGGSATAATARRVVELGDGWSPLGGTDAATLAKGMETIRAQCERVGRDPTEIGLRSSLRLPRTADGRADVAAMTALVPEVVAAGATCIQLPPLSALVREPAEVREVLGALVRDVRDAAASVPSGR